MDRRLFLVVVVLISVCASFGWMAWGWNDVTSAGPGQGWRPQTREDHVASVLFAVGRVLLAWLFAYGTLGEKRS